MVLLWTHISVWCHDYWIFKTRNCWCSVDAHFHDVVTFVSCTVSVEKAAMNSYIKYCHQATLRLAKMQDQQSLTLHWHSFSGWVMKRVDKVFATEGGQYFMYGCLQLIASRITHDVRTKIVDPPLTLSFRMGQGARSYWFYHYKRPKPDLWMFASNHHLDYPRWKTKNRWHSIDAFQNRAGNLSLLFLHLQAASTSLVDDCNQSPLRLPMMQSQTSLMLHWCPFLEWGSDWVACSFADKGCQYDGDA